MTVYRWHWLGSILQMAAHPTTKSRAQKFESHPGHISCLEIDPEIMSVATLPLLSDTTRAVASYWQKYVLVAQVSHQVDLSLPSKSTDWLNMT